MSVLLKARFVRGADAKEADRDAAKATGTALEKAGKKLQEHAKPGDQKVP